MLRNVVWQMSFDVVEKTAASLFRVKEDVNYGHQSIKQHGTTSKNNVIVADVRGDQVHLS
jgi:hypothetical protein